MSRITGSLLFFKTMQFGYIWLDEKVKLKSNCVKAKLIIIQQVN